MSSIGLSKLHFTCPVEDFAGNMTFLKKFEVFLLRNNRWASKFELLSRKNPTALSKWNCTYLEDILRNCSCTFCLLPSHFGIERKLFGLLREILLSGFLKLHFSCPGFFRIFSPENCIRFLLFLCFDYELFEVLAEDSRKVPKKDILYVQNNNLRKMAFRNFYLVYIIFGLSSKENSDVSQKVLESFQNCLLGVQSKLLCDWVFFDYLYSIPCLSDFEQKNRSFVRGTPTPTALLKLHSMCLKTIFDEKVFQTLLFFDHFRTLFKFYLTIW